MHCMAYILITYLAHKNKVLQSVRLGGCIVLRCDILNHYHI